MCKLHQRSHTLTTNFHWETQTQVFVFYLRDDTEFCEATMLIFQRHCRVYLQGEVNLN
jgi:hypothetical protein